jgi:hypothetical protein
MVKVCRVPKFSYQVFTANELSGWSDGIAYTPQELVENRKEKQRKRKKKIQESIVVIPPPPIRKLEIGYSL